MARPLRINVAGVCYHVMARGNARMAIYLDHVDEDRFLSLLAETVERFQVDCGVYCLMPNHFHLVVRPRIANLSRAMRHLDGVYAQWWNHRHARVGHLLQGRFKAQVVQEERYLAAVSRYVVLNPVRAGLVSQPGDWRWSSYRATAGLDPMPSWLSPGFVLDAIHPGGTPAARAERFVQCVAGPDPLVEAGAAIRADRRVMGDEVFAARFADQAALAGSAVPARDRQLARPSLAHLVSPGLDVAELASRAREAKAMYGYTYTDVARHLGMHPDALRRVLRRSPDGRGAADSET